MRLSRNLSETEDDSMDLRTLRGIIKNIRAMNKQGILRDIRAANFKAGLLVDS